MESITLANDIAAIWFMVVFGFALLAQVFDCVRRWLK